MARKIRPLRQMTGLYYAREARGISRSELVELSGISKQQLSRLENGIIRLRLDHLEPFAKHLGYTPEQLLLWGRYPGTGGEQPEAGAASRPEYTAPRPVRRIDVPEIDPRAAAAEIPGRKKRKEGGSANVFKLERWHFPESFVREQLHTSSERLLVVETEGDSMVPTIASGERVIVDTAHTTPTPDGLYAIRDAFNCVVLRRLQLLRSARPARVNIISDNPNHANEEVALGELQIVGKAVCTLKFL